MYEVVCIGSRHIQPVVKERAERLLDILKHAGVQKGTAFRLLRTEFTPFELFFYEEFVHRSVGTHVPAGRNDNQCARLVREIHPAPRRLSKKNFIRMKGIAAAVQGAQLVVAVPRDGKGRGYFALRLATALHKGYIDLSSPETDRRLDEMEAHLAVLNRQQAYAEQKRAQAKQEKIQRIRNAVRNDRHLVGQPQNVVDNVLDQLDMHIADGPGMNVVGIQFISVYNPRDGRTSVGINWKYKNRNPYAEPIPPPSPPRLRITNPRPRTGLFDRPRPEVREYEIEDPTTRPDWGRQQRNTYPNLYQEIVTENNYITTTQGTATNTAATYTFTNNINDRNAGFWRIDGNPYAQVAPQAVTQETMLTMTQRLARELDQQAVERRTDNQQRLRAQATQIIEEFQRTMTDAQREQVMDVINRIDDMDLEDD